MDFNSFPITLLLIAANVVISLIGFSNQSFMEKGLMWPYYIKRNNQYSRFILSGFLHADYMHLLFNMLTLYFFGQFIEVFFAKAFPNGRIWYVVLYFLGMIVADIPSYLKNKDNAYYRSLGASGAVSAVVFAAIIFNPWGQIRIYVLPLSMLLYAFLYIFYCIYSSKQNAGNINHDAHLWGSIFGLVFTIALLIAMRPDVIPYVFEDLKNPSLLGRKYAGEVIKYLLGY